MNDMIRDQPNTGQILNSCPTHVDSHFAIGHSHEGAGESCQDYAGHGTLVNGWAWAAVTDGCSTAAGPTDVGARTLLAAFRQQTQGIAPVTLQRNTEMATKDVLAVQKQPVFWSEVDLVSANTVNLPHELGVDFLLGPDFVENMAKNFASTPVLFSPDEKFATLVGLVAGEGQAHALILGDGSVLLRDRAGVLHHWELVWELNMPGYIAYKEYPTAAARWRAAQPSLPATLTYRRYGADLQLLAETTQNLSLAALEHGCGFQFDLVAWDAVSISVATDGLTRLSNLSPVAALDAFTAYKNTTGAFQKRRSLRALRDFERAGSVPTDDVAIATALWLPALENQT